MEGEGLIRGRRGKREEAGGCYVDEGSYGINGSLITEQWTLLIGCLSALWPVSVQW